MVCRTSSMPSRDPSPPLSLIERPRCARCGTRMVLLRIAPGPSGFDYRTFECGKCDNVDTKMVFRDPMKSDAVSRLTDCLKPPR
jgi:hypothetical protein